MNEIIAKALKRYGEGYSSTGASAALEKMQKERAVLFNSLKPLLQRPNNDG